MDFIIAVVLLGLGILGLICMVINILIKMRKNNKLGVGSLLLILIFSVMWGLGILVGVDVTSNTKITDGILAKINETFTGNKEIITNSNEKQLPNNLQQQNQSENAKDEIKQIAVNQEQAKSSINTNNNQTTQALPTQEANNQSANQTSSPVKSDNTLNTVKYPAEIINIKLRDVGNYTTSLVYNIKNNTDKTIYTYKIVILLYDENNNPVYIKSNNGISDNMILEIHHDYQIKPSETRGAVANNVINSDKVKKVKIIISEVQYVGTSDLWVNPDIDNIIQNRNKY